MAVGSLREDWVTEYGARYRVSLSGPEIAALLNCLNWAQESIPLGEFRLRVGMEYNDAEELWKGIHAGWYRLKYPPGSLQVDTEQAFAFLPPLGYELTRSGTQEDGTEFVEYSSPSLEVRVVQTDWASADVDFTQPGQTRTRVPLKAFTPYWDDPFAFPPVRFTQGRLAGLKRLAERTERYAGDAIRGDQSSFQRALDRTRRMDGEYVD